MYLTRETIRTSRIVADTKKLYSHGALSVTMQLYNSDITLKGTSDTVGYTITLSKTDLEEMMKLITDREEEIKEML